MTVFGRFDIHFPDGRQETRALQGDTVTVGSAPGNSIQLAVTGLAAHHLHLRHEHEEDAVYLTDLGSALGTKLDGALLPPHIARRLPAVAQLQLGQLQITYNRQSDNPTIVMSALSEPTQPLDIGFRAELEVAELPVWCAAGSSLKLEISNLEDETADFRFESAGLPEGWVKPKRLTYPIHGQDSNQFRLHIKPTRRADMPPGEYPLTVTVTRLSEPERALQLRLLVKLGGFAGLSLDLYAERVNSQGAFTLYLLNLGNESLRLSLSAAANAQLDLRLAQTEIELTAGERAQVSGQVAARRRPVFGRPRRIPFIVQAQAHSPGRYLLALPASLEVKAALPPRVLTALAIVCAALVILAAALLQPPAPEISRFSLSPAQAAQGTPVSLAWTASNAQRYIIEVNRVAIADLPASAASYILQTAAYSDPIEIALIALQGADRAIATRQLALHQPVSITEFAADRPFMLRHVQAELSIRWQVTGAVTLTVSRPLAFETISESGVGADAGEIRLRGAPAEAFQILLRAEDEGGAISERRLEIGLREPECSPRQAAPLYRGPGTGFEQVSLAQANLPALARGRTEDGHWLQVELASGKTGWGAAAGFACQDFAPAALRVISDLPPLPPPTARLFLP